MVEIDWLKEVDIHDEPVKLPSDDKLSRLSELANAQLKLERDIEMLEELISYKKADLAKISEQQIPDLMQELGMREFKLSDGIKVSVSPYYTGKITDPKAYDWLKANDFDEMIKHEVKVSLRSSDEGSISKLENFLHNEEISYSSKDGVHHMTLNAFIKDQITHGQALPHELFNVYVGKKTKLSKG